MADAHSLIGMRKRFSGRTVLLMMTATPTFCPQRGPVESRPPSIGRPQSATVWSYPILTWVSWPRGP